MNANNEKLTNYIIATRVSEMGMEGEVLYYDILTIEASTEEEAYKKYREKTNVTYFYPEIIGEVIDGKIIIEQETFDWVAHSLAVSDYRVKCQLDEIDRLRGITNKKPKQKLQITLIEGARGVGKTRIVQGLKKITKSCMIFQLSGIDKVENEKEYIRNHYLELHRFFNQDRESQYRLYLDRTFTTELMYCRSGFKAYSFDDVFIELLNQLKDYEIEMNFILLTTKEENFITRLNNVDREGKVEYQNLEYKAESSIKEQRTFIQIFNEIKDFGYDKFHVHFVENEGNPDDVVKSIYNLINGGEL